MRSNIIIALVLAGLGSLAYLAWNTSVSTSTKAQVPTTEPGPELKAPPAQDQLVRPRRMRSHRSISGDTLAEPSALRSPRMPIDRRGEPAQPLDTDGDGEISLEERAISGRSVERSTIDEQRATRDEIRSAAIERRTNLWISNADTDSDGVLSLSEAELSSPRLRRILDDFDESDRNGDGVISKDELRRAAETWRAKRRSRIDAR